MAIETLMKNTGCTVWPERWRELYPLAMARYEKEGCIYATPAYYDGLQETYQMFNETDLDILKRGAVAVARKEALCRLLALISYALADADQALADMEGFELPKAPAGEELFPYEILIGLATFSRVDYTYNKLHSEGVPADMIQTILGYYSSGLHAHSGYHGREGYENFRWQQKIANGHLLPIGRFNIEIAATMPAKAQIFVNAKGEEAALAHDITLHRSGFPLGSKYFEDEAGSFTAEVEETEDCYIGHPYLENGYVSKEKITLLKSEWEKKLSFGDKVVALHIPSKRKFTPEIVDASLKEAEEFIKKHYPEEWCGVFRCYSWMCDPQLLELLPESSNISHFCRRFKHLAVKSDEKGALRSVFLVDGENIDYDSLPEHTSLLKLLKEHYKSGKAIYDTVGYFFVE